MRIEIIREKGDTLQAIVNTACACRQAFKCLVVVSLDDSPAPSLPLAEIPFDKPHLHNQQVTSRKPGALSKRAWKTAALIALLYVVIGGLWYLKGRA